MKKRCILILLLAACQGGSSGATCDEAINHMASLSVEKGGAALPADQRARHQKVLARAIGREYQPNCSNDDSALIGCVLEASDPATARDCWRK